jgi:transposase
MKYIQGHNRNQITIFPQSLEQSIDPDNEVRLIELFVKSLNLKEIGFRSDYIENGRPAYHPTVLLGLLLYGYLNKTRSSRDLEKEARRNIEVMWLLSGLTPDHNTISRFLRHNRRAIQKVFRATVKMAQGLDLIGGTLIAGDSTKMRAQNSKKNNFNQSKIERQVAYIDTKVEEYLSELEQAGEDDEHQLQQAIKVQHQRKERYHDLKRQLEQSGDTQVSASDSESRLLMIRNNISEVCYNVQTTTDSKHKILIDFKVTNQNDMQAMGMMVRRARTILKSNDFTGLYDKGYHSGPEIRAVQLMGVNAMAAVPALPSGSQAPDPAYNMSEFTWNPDSHTYTCPQRQTLTTTGTWHKKKRSGGRKGHYLFQQFKTRACKGCEAKQLCTSNPRGRLIERTEYTPYVEENQRKIEQNQTLYKQRQAIVEHPYGTIKRQWGFNYILSKKGIARASADVGLMLTAYNLRRLINILGIKRLFKILNIIVLRFTEFFSTFQRKISVYLAVRATLDCAVKNVKYLVFTTIFGKNLAGQTGL